MLSGQNVFHIFRLTFQNITMQVLPRKVDNLPSDRPFIQPGSVSQTQASQLLVPVNCQWHLLPHRPLPIPISYYVPQWGCVEMVKGTETPVDNYHTLNIKCFAVNRVPFVAVQPQKKGSCPIIVKQNMWKVFPVWISCLLSNMSPLSTLLLKIWARLNQFWKT